MQSHLITAGLAVGLLGTTAASAGVFSDVLTPVTTDVNGNAVNGFSNTRNAVGDTYFFVPGIGGAGGFAIAGTFTPTLFDTAPAPIGTLVTNAVVTADETQSPLVPVDTFDVSLSLTSSDGELFPDGFNVGGMPANTAGLFLGDNAGGDPLDFSAPVVVNTATITFNDALGGEIAAFNVGGSSQFSDGPNGTWDGGFGFSFGAGSAGLGVAEALFEANVTLVPEPGSASLLLLAGAGLLTRRRK